jgi:hypothetical protein
LAVVIGGSPPAKYSYNNIDIDKLVDEAMKGGRGQYSRRLAAEELGLLDAGRALPSASSMMLRMVRAQRPHWALQPRKP